MKKLSLFLVLLFFFQILNAQFGISAGYKPITAKNWERVIGEHPSNLSGNESNESFANGIHLGVDYWFRLKNYRVEFVPELSFSRFTRIYTLGEGKEDFFNAQFLGLHFNTNFYILDLKGDCDCPTFSKEGNSLEKGFFIQLAPGVDYIFNSYKTDGNSQKANDIVPSVGIGIGIDFGLNDLLTVTPMVKIHHYFNAEWEGLNTIYEPTKLISEDLNTNNVTQLFAGLRIGLRLDSDKY